MTEQPGGLPERPGPGAVPPPPGLASPPAPPGAPPGYAGRVPPGAVAVPGEGGPHTLSGWWPRVGARLIDGLLALLCWIAVGALVGGLGAIGYAFSSDAGDVGVIVGAIVGLSIGYFVFLFFSPVLMARSKTGQTPGKKAFNIRVIRTSGEPMEFAWAALREVAVKHFAMNFASAATGGLAGIADYLWPLWDAENRALHDFVCQTRVVRARS